MRRITATLPLYLIVSCTLITNHGMTQEELSWSQWRGPSRDGKLAQGSHPWPNSLSDSSLIKSWQVDLSEGYSSPVISNGLVYTVETQDKQNEITRAFELTSGSEKWSAKWAGAMKVPFFASKNGSWIKGTPAVEGNSLFVSGMRDVLVHLNAQTGEEIWRIDFVEREKTQVPAFGHVTSPLVDGDAMYIHAGMAVSKIDIKTGKTLWRTLEDRRAMLANAFSSPVIATIHGQRQLVTQTRSVLAGIDLENGSVLWSIPVKAYRGMNILTPTVIGNRIFTASYGGGCFLFEIAKNDAKYSVKTLWINEEIEGYMSSPLEIDDHIYLHARDQKIYCIDLNTGKPTWSSEEKFGNYISMITNGQQILALDQRGILMLIDVSPKELLVRDRREVSSEETWGHIALVGNKILIRGLKSLSAFEWKSNHITNR